MAATRWLVAIIICCLMANSAMSQQKDPRIRNHVISDTGDLIPNQPIAETAQVLATQVITTSPAPILTNVPARRSLSVEELTSTLDTLFEWGPASTRYATNFLMLPGILDFKTDTKAALLATPPDTTYLYLPYNVKQKIGIRLSRPGPLTSLPAFASDPGNAIFVRLDGFGSLVPTQVAELSEASFINGLVTRLILGEYARKWKKDLKLSFANNSTFNAIIGDAFVNPANYAAPSPTNFPDAVRNILASNPVNPVSLLYGWRAGDDLDGLDGSNTKYRDAVWKLIGSRFSLQDMGRMTSFTLTYLSGYAKNQRITAIVNGGTQEALKDSTKILESLATDPNIAASKNMISGFIQNVVAELYVISSNTALPEKEKKELESVYFSFIKGLTSGSSDAADQVYLDVFKLAYGIGYQTGFRDGYAEGYAAGYKDGYAIGYKNAWAEASKTIDALQSQIASLQSQLDSANSGSFWDDLSKIGSSIGTAVGAIAGVIGLFA